MKKMMLACAAFLLTVIGVTFADVQSMFEGSKIVPDILDHAPIDGLEVKYGNKEVEFGNEFLPKDTLSIPDVHYNYTSGILYTLVMTDPDNEDRGYNREFQHWLVGNIPEDKVSEGEVLTAYVGCGPPLNTGKHRYILLLYKQNQGSITFDEIRINNRDSRRFRFSNRQFAEKYNLEGPIAGNYFIAEYDNSVPATHKQMGIVI